MIVKLLTEHQLKRRLKRLVRVYTSQNVKSLEISCTGSIMSVTQTVFMFIVTLLVTNT